MTPCRNCVHNCRALNADDEALLCDHCRRCRRAAERRAAEAYHATAEATDAEWLAHLGVAVPRAVAYAEG